MPVLPGFSDNPFLTREDTLRGSKALLTPLLPYFSPAKARVTIPETIGVQHDDTAAQLEGFARPLFVVGALLHANEPADELLKPWIQGFKAGTDPTHPEYWGGFENLDQRMVEAEMIAFALLAGQRSGLWEQFDNDTQTNTASWLMGLLDKEFRTNNWLWFRVMAILALIKVCGHDSEELRTQMSSDLELLDSMYLQDGWSSDGVWPDADEVLETEASSFDQTGKTNQRFWARQADYYSGSFAIQFSQLIYVKFASDIDPVRAEKYREQARQFGAQFWHYFDSGGAAIPFGRSLIYRFACAGFFAALALAEVDQLPPPIGSPGAIRGFLMRHMRWWAKRSDGIFRSDGTLNLGWAYPNIFLTEEYNSPQSVYWALKSLVVVGLTADKKFWTDDEGVYPEQSPGTCWLPAPRQLLCNHPGGNHHFMLNPSQYLVRTFKSATAKYCKFAYSSAFPLSLAVGNTLVGQIAADNALFLSRDGTESYATKRLCTDARIQNIALHAQSSSSEDLLAVSAQWFPWADRQVSVTSTLIPPSDRWPDWHVRIHRIVVRKEVKSLDIVEGGFAIHGQRRSDGRLIPEVAADKLDTGLGEADGVLRDRTSAACVFSLAGVSGISSTTHVQSSTALNVITTVSATRSESNTNLMACRALLPVSQHSISGPLAAGDEIVLVSKVFAISSEANGSRSLSGTRPLARWLDQPQVKISPDTLSDAGDYIYIDDI